VTYKPRYLDEVFRFELKLSYQDKNDSGRFEPEIDSFRGLYFVLITQPDKT